MSRPERPGGSSTADDLNLRGYEYALPPELVAIHPAARRDEARLLVYERATDRVTHRRFGAIGEYLRPTDLLVLNDSKVEPVALTTADGRVEILLIEETSPRHWISLVKPGARAKPGQRLTFKMPESGATEPAVTAEVLKTLPGGERVLRFFCELDLARFGAMPIPPYIRKRRRELGEAEIAPDDRERYQTVFARAPGSVAAPTAGLHFTSELLARFPHAFVTLHVGLGTFRPVKTEQLRNHDMHEESYTIPPGLEEAYAQADRVVAVGTTAARVLESAPHLRPYRGKTRLFIHPPYTFQRVDLLLTNFHLPHSTLLMLVSALVGREKLLALYQEAIAQRYQFYSYGDAMLIL